MGIKSTKYVTVAWAIDRIKTIDNLATNKRYRTIEQLTSEHDDWSLYDFLESYEPVFDVENLEQWTNEMLGAKLDQPFFRESIFDNYIVTDDLSLLENRA
jgi:hypothetical protein